jgi:hypothetical protein
MSPTTLDEAQIKTLFKQAVLELLREERDLIYELFVEALEDVALARAIEEGESSETVSRAEVFRVLASS